MKQHNAIYVTYFGWIKRHLKSKRKHRNPYRHPYLQCDNVIVIA